jgi:hypothetical protein
MRQIDVTVPRSGTTTTPRPLAQYAASLWAQLLAVQPAIALRFLCYLGGLACFNAVPSLQGAGPFLGQRTAAVLMVVCLLTGLVCFYLACCTTTPHWLYRLWPHRHGLLISGVSATLCASGLSIGVLATLPLTILRPDHYANDAVAATECATHLVVQGHNPYPTFNLVACFARHGLTGVYTTPLQAGPFTPIRIYPTQQDLLRTFARVQHDHVRHPAMFESYFNYPAGAFLLPAPFAALGWHDMSTFYLLWAILAYGGLVRWAPHGWRPWLLLLASANATLWTTIADGQSNVLDVFLIVAGWATWRRSWLSAVLMGAAVATRQEAWFFAPFYLVLSGCLVGWRAAGVRLAVMGGLFSLLNAPFIALSPSAWLHGVLGPLTDPMYPLGEGVIALATSGVLPLWPRSVYAGLELAALVACLLLYVRVCRRQSGTGPVLALVPVVFAWRSLFTYFYVALPLLALWVFLVALSTDRSAQDVSSEAYMLRPQGAAGRNGPVPARTAHPGVSGDEDDPPDRAERPAAA